MWDNLREYVEKTVAAHHRCVRERYSVLEQAAAGQAPDPQQAAGQASTAHAENRPRVVKARQRYEQVQALKAEGKNVTTITGSSAWLQGPPAATTMPRAPTRWWQAHWRDGRAN